MNTDFEKTWETYASAWKVTSADEKRTLFEKCLDLDCEYNDPLMTTRGWGELVAYMLNFHQQVPGGHFVTDFFLAHNNQSIATWEMRNGENNGLGKGISYGKYNDQGKLVAMTGFFEAPNP